MNEKSHVSMEQRVCAVCGKTYDTGAILLDARLKATLDTTTVTGWGLCGEHKQPHEEGFIALVECDPRKSERPGADGTITPAQVHRTGIVTYVPRAEFLQLFRISPAQYTAPCVFVEQAVTEFVKAHVPQVHKH